MKKAEFKKEVQEVLAGLEIEVNQDKAIEVSDAIFQRVADLVAKGEEVPVGVLGKFTSAVRSARVGRNVQTGEAIDIPEKTVPKYKASKQFKELVNK